MSEQRIARIEQLRENIKREIRTLAVLFTISVLGYIWACLQGSIEQGWIAFVIAVATSFGTLLVAIALTSYELEANLLEGPRTY